ncbi:hypothetical protein AVEN_48789-1, partial [Araneus ventricosus]
KMLLHVWSYSTASEREPKEAANLTAYPFVYSTLSLLLRLSPSRQQ